MADSDNKPLEAAILVQKEVSERVRGAKKNSLLGHIMNNFYETKAGIAVGPENFDPRPKVDSEVLILHRRSQPLVERNWPETLLAMKAGFSQSRKMLKSSLAAGLRLDRSKAEELLKAAGIEPMLRAEALGIEDWARLGSVYKNDATRAS